MRKLAVMAILASVLLMSGCGGVQMNQKYSKWTDETAALAKETDERWDTLSDPQKKQAFHGNAECWQQMKAAKDGKTVQ